MALDWLPILPDVARHRRLAPASYEAVEPLLAAYTPAPDLLATLTFFPLLALPAPRPSRAQAEIVIVEPFDTPTRVAPLQWLAIPEPLLPRTRRARQEVVVIDPTYSQALVVAASLAWQPILPSPTRHRPQDRVSHWVLDPTFGIPATVTPYDPSVLGWLPILPEQSRPAHTAWRDASWSVDPTIAAVAAAAAVPTVAVREAATSPFTVSDATREVLTVSDLITEALTVSDLTQETLA